MNMLSKYLSFLTSSFYSCILLCKEQLQFPLKNAPKRHSRGKGQAGLKTLFPSEEKRGPRPRLVHRGSMEEAKESEPWSPPPPSLSWLWSPSSPALRTSIMGDVIGTESGDCMVTEEEELMRAEPEAGNVVRCRERRKKMNREFPPPLTLLRETGKMPWSLEREYSGEGRLVLAAEIVSGGHKCCVMETRREDGRLTMWLVADECGYSIDDEDEKMEFDQGFEVADEEFAMEGQGWNESERCGVYSSGPGLGPAELFALHRSYSLPDIYLGRPASAPLRPMTPVM